MGSKRLEKGYCFERESVDSSVFHLVGYVRSTMISTNSKVNVSHFLYIKLRFVRLISRSSTELPQYDEQLIIQKADAFHCHSSTAPSYVTGMLHRKPLHTRNTRSSSCTMPHLKQPSHSKATLGDRSFSFASSSVWNSIPNDVRCAPSLSSFKSRLKTYVFCSVYKD